MLGDGTGERRDRLPGPLVRWREDLRRVSVFYIHIHLWAEGDTPDTPSELAFSGALGGGVQSRRAVGGNGLFLVSWDWLSGFSGFLHLRCCSDYAKYI